MGDDADGNMAVFQHLKEIEARTQALHQAYISELKKNDPVYADLSRLEASAREAMARYTAALREAFATHRGQIVPVYEPDPTGMGGIRERAIVTPEEAMTRVGDRRLANPAVEKMQRRNEASRRGERDEAEALRLAASRKIAQEHLR